MDNQLVESIVDQVLSRLQAGGSKPEQSSAGAAELVTPDIRAGRIMLGISARHIHLTNEHVEVLFGKGAKLTMLRPLIQTGEFASEQMLTLVGPTGKCLGPVRVLGPTRKASQVEIALTDCYALGLKKLPPIRPSGDHTDTFGITMVGPAGSVTLTSGLIRANRHIHMHTSQAEALGLKNAEYVDVRVEGERPAILLGCQIRAHEMFLAEMHLDTDDANAIGVKSGAMVQIIKK